MGKLFAWTDSIDPRKVAMWLSILSAVAGAVVSGQLPIADMFGAIAAPFIIAWSKGIVVIVPIIVASHSGQDLFSQTRGAAKAVLGYFLLAGVVAYVMAALLIAPAFASGHLPDDQAFAAASRPAMKHIQLAMVETRPAAKLAPAPAPAPATDPVSGALTAIQNIENGVIQNTIAALQEADADAGTVVIPATATTPATVKDPISHACYPAQIQYLQSLPTAQPIKTPAPYNVIVLFQYKRDFVNMLLSGSLVPTYLKLGCSAMLGQETLILVGTLGLVGISPALLAPLSAFGTSIGGAAATIPLIQTLLPK